jgi:hypothetical protein
MQVDIASKLNINVTLLQESTTPENREKQLNCIKEALDIRKKELESIKVIVNKSKPEN